MTAPNPSPYGEYNYYRRLLASMREEHGVPQSLSSITSIARVWCHSMGYPVPPIPTYRPRGEPPTNPDAAGTGNRHGTVADRTDRDK